MNFGHCNCYVINYQSIIWYVPNSVYNDLLFWLFLNMHMLDDACLHRTEFGTMHIMNIIPMSVLQNILCFRLNTEFGIVPVQYILILYWTSSIKLICILINYHYYYCIPFNCTYRIRYFTMKGCLMLLYFIYYCSCHLIWYRIRYWMSTEFEPNSV